MIGTIVVKGAPRLGVARCHHLAPRLKGGDASSRRRSPPARRETVARVARVTSDDPSRYALLLLLLLLLLFLILLPFAVEFQRALIFFLFGGSKTMPFWPLFI